MAPRDDHPHPHGAKTRRRHHGHRRHQRAQHRPLRSGLRRRLPAGTRSHISLHLPECSLRRQGRLYQQPGRRFVPGARRAPGALCAGVVRRRSRRKARYGPAGIPPRNCVRPAGQPGARMTPLDSLIPAQPIEGGVPFSSNYLAECLKEGAARIGWKPRPNGPRKRMVDGKYRGMGMAACIYKTGQSQSSAVVKMKPDGSAELLMSITEIGQGAWTILRQIVAETLSVNFGNVHAIFADTAMTPFAHSTSGSTTTFTSGLAAHQAAADAKQRLLESAAKLLEVEPTRLALGDGFAAIADTPDIKIPVSHVIRRQPNQTIVGEAKLRAGSRTHIINSFAAHFSEVEVDPDTGAVRVLRYVAVHDSGRIIHPEAARGQIIGGVVQGLGYALMEEIPMDPDTGAPLTLNLDSFKIPNLLDTPPIEAVLIEHPDPIGPYGAKVLRGPPLVPVAAAIANAVYDATGVRIRDLPITSEKVLNAMRNQRR